MVYQVIYIVLSIVVVVVTLTFVIFPGARYKAPESELSIAKNKSLQSKKEGVEEASAETETDG